MRPLEEFRKQGGRVIYFMDDDLLDPNALADLPSAYRKKIYSMATRHRSFLESLCNEVWVSTPFLARKYAYLSPELLVPRAQFAQAEKQEDDCFICYHGTASHRAELDWLRPIIGAVQNRQPRTHFEVFGDLAVNRLYRDFPRTSVLHPMSWPNYFDYTVGVSRDIALAPLMPSTFNPGRGPTKFFDYTRMGAVGIYTDVEPYSGFIRHEIDGILLPNDPEHWIEMIGQLVRSPERRRRIATAAAERALSMT